MRLNQCPGDATADPQQLVGALVDVKGTPATAYNAPLRHLISVDVYVQLPGHAERLQTAL